MVGAQPAQPQVVGVASKTTVAGVARTPESPEWPGPCHVSNRDYPAEDAQAIQ